MYNDKSSIISDNSIWDLHIHTCKCPKASDEFGKLNIDDYINKLVDIIKNYSDLKMISFTDHNVVNADVYKAFLDKKIDITLLVGIEVDTFLDENDKDTNNFKHIIFYFDNNLFDLDEHSKKINDKLNKQPILLFNFLDFLITEIKVPFLISPHFIKQGKRGIDSILNNEDNIKKHIDKYIDQMCCFWETSNNSNIQRAIDFLKDFDKDEKISIIAFSDSNNFSKLTNYLNKPHQYFSALPTFNGLRLVGTDCRRISFQKSNITNDIKAHCLGKIVQGTDNVIYLSNGLNSIIGGRGSGKSILIDGIANYLDQSIIKDTLISKDRIEYLSNLKFKVYDMNGNDLSTHSFKFDYYNQGYAQELFSNNNKNLAQKPYFKDKFKKLREFNKEQIKLKILDELQIDKEIEVDIDNITSIDSKIVKIPSEKKEIKFRITEKEIPQIKYADYSSQLSYLSKKTFIPKELINNEEIKKAQTNLIKTIYFETHKRNIEIIYSNLTNKIIAKYKDMLKNNNEQKKEKEKIGFLIRQSIKNLFVDINNRVKLINNYISIATKKFDDNDEITSPGYDKRVFIFKRSLKCQNILNYLFTTFNNFFDSAKLKKYNVTKSCKEDLFKMVQLYCYNCNDVIMDSKSSNELDKELESLKSYSIDITDEILIQDELSTKNLSILSPGTRANLLLEYIVFNSNSKPLLIDQPEDNIDNETIYNQLTHWFSDLKKQRQVIVVTHDANIVVNADSENVIICKQMLDNTYDYKCGALEFQNNLNNISLILDGGKDAIERRLLKYGK